MKLKKHFSIFLIIVVVLGYSSNVFAFIEKKEQGNFVSVKNCHFQLNGKPYHYVGTNFWYGANIGSKNSSENRKRLTRELDRLKAMGINNLRIMGGSEGPDSEPWRIKPSMQPAANEYNEYILDGLDFLLNEMKVRNMYAVVPLTNFWPWSGGMAQYLSWSTGKAIPYPPPAAGGDWDKYSKFTADFYTNEKAKNYFNNYINYILNRTNKYNGLKYKNDSTIMSWELVNEPRVVTDKTAFFNWIKDTSSLIKKIDKNHLVTTGSEGTIENGDMFLKSHDIDTIDYLTFHLWVENWNWYDPTNPKGTYENAIKLASDYIDKHIKIAKQLNKPIVMEEFGIARDNRSYDPNSTTKYRDSYYKYIFEKLYNAAEKDKCLAGVNFWAWAGEVRSGNTGGIWQEGDDFIGDPPHELQGWYSVYDTDKNTIKIISDYANKFNNIS